MAGCHDHLHRRLQPVVVISHAIDTYFRPVAGGDAGKCSCGPWARKHMPSCQRQCSNVQCHLADGRGEPFVVQWRLPSVRRCHHLALQRAGGACGASTATLSSAPPTTSDFVSSRAEPACCSMASDTTAPWLYRLCGLPAGALVSQIAVASAQQQSAAVASPHVRGPSTVPVVPLIALSAFSSISGVRANSRCPRAGRSTVPKRGPLLSGLLNPSRARRGSTRSPHKFPPRSPPRPPYSLHQRVSE